MKFLFILILIFSSNSKAKQIDHLFAGAVISTAVSKATSGDKYSFVLSTMAGCGAGFIKETIDYSASVEDILMTCIGAYGASFYWSF